MKSKSQAAIHILVLALVGLAGWCLTSALVVWPPLGMMPWQLSPELGVCFLLAAVGRLLAFRGFRGGRIALDSAFYIAAAFLCGVIAAATLVLANLTLDALTRHLFGLGGYLRFQRGARLTVIAQVLYKGGLPALVLLAVGVSFGGLDIQQMDDTTLSWVVPSFSVGFLVLHYALTGGGYYLEGGRSSALGGSMLRLVGAELVLLPLALAMVLGFRHQGLGLFFLIGSTVLLLNAMVKRVVILSDRSHRRAEELATLNEVGRIISASLERDALMRNLAAATLHLVQHTSRFMIGLVDTDDASLSCQFFDESGDPLGETRKPIAEGLMGWVMRHRKPLLLDELSRQAEHYTSTLSIQDRRFHSWLGVPLLVYDDVVGIMVVQTVESNAYSDDDLRVLKTIGDQAAVALENARLYEMATIDGLTGLFVRRYFDQRLDEEWERSSRYESSFTLVMFDLDDFKRLNDSYGHQVGDQVLRAAAAVVRDKMRRFDIPARYGGEEFAFILPRTTLEEALLFAQRIRTDLAATLIKTKAGELRVTASLGIASALDPGVDSAAELVARADRALYEAKTKGKNRVEPPIILDAGEVFSWQQVVEYS